MNEKQEFLDWLLKPRRKGYPFVTFRSSAMKAELNLCIPMDEMAEFFGVERIKVRDMVYLKTK
jgi:hypothetical protein